MSTKNLLKLGDPRSNSIFDQFKDKKQFLTAWNEMMFVIEHIERLQTTGAAATEETKKMNADHLEEMSTDVTDELNRGKTTTAPLDDNQNQFPIAGTSTAMQRKSTEKSQQKMETRATADENVGKKTNGVAAKKGAQSKLTKAKNKDASEIQKMVASKYPIVVLHKLPETETATATDKGNKKDSNEKHTAISTRTRQQAKLGRK